jgi:hypothetical protein
MTTIEKHMPFHFAREGFIQKWRNAMNESPTIKAMIKQLYELKVDLEEALWQPDPDHYEWLSECFDNLCQEITDAGGVIPDDLL